MVIQQTSDMSAMAEPLLDGTLHRGVAPMFRKGIGAKRSSRAKEECDLTTSTLMLPSRPTAKSKPI